MAFAENLIRDNNRIIIIYIFSFFNWKHIFLNVYTFSKVCIIVSNVNERNRRKSKIYENRTLKLHFVIWCKIIFKAEMKKISSFQGFLRCQENKEGLRCINYSVLRRGENVRLHSIKFWWLKLRLYSCLICLKVSKYIVFC